MSILAPTTIKARGVEQPLSTTHHNAATATGVGTAAVLSGLYNMILLTVSGGATATIKAQVTQDSSVWQQVTAINVFTGEKIRDIDASITAIYLIPVVGAARFRVNVSSYSSGNVTVASQASLWSGTMPEPPDPFANTHHSSATATGTGSNATLSYLYDTLIFTVTGGATATLRPQITMDDVTWLNVQCFRVDTGEAAWEIDASVPMTYRVNVSGAKRFRINIYSYSSGNVTATSVAVRRSTFAIDSTVLQAIQAANEATQAAVEDTDTGYTPLGAHTTIADLSSAATITPAAGAREVIMQAYAQAVRYTLDGTTPTATTGFKLAADAQAVVPVGGGSQVKVIEETASATLQYQAVG